MLVTLGTFLDLQLPQPLQRHHFFLNSLETAAVALGSQRLFV